jgi:DNA-binding XRE family transcriptional regulator
MVFNRTAYKRVLAEAGFTKQELASIYGVSRQTVYDWSKAAAPTQLALAQRAAKATEALTTGLDKRLLPLGSGLSAETRKTRIDVIIKTIMENMKPGRS